MNKPSVLVKMESDLRILVWLHSDFFLLLNKWEWEQKSWTEISIFTITLHFFNFFHPFFKGQIYTPYHLISSDIFNSSFLSSKSHHLFKSYKSFSFTSSHVPSYPVPQPIFSLFFFFFLRYFSNVLSLFLSIIQYLYTIRVPLFSFDHHLTTISIASVFSLVMIKCNI